MIASRRARTLDDELTAQRNQGRSTLEAAEEQRKAAEAAQAALGTPGDPSHATSLEALNRASEEWIRAEEAASPIREALLKKADELEAAKTPTWHERARRYVVGGLVGVAALICAALVNIGEGPLPVLWGWVAVVIAALLASFVATTLYTASNEQRIESEERGTRPTWVARYRFPLVGLVVFIAIPIVMAVGVYFREEDAPQVEPLAFLSGDGTPVVGFLIAETSDRLYYGTFESSVLLPPRPPGVLVTSDRRLGDGRGSAAHGVRADHRCSEPERWGPFPRRQAHRMRSRRFAVGHARRANGQEALLSSSATKRSRRAPGSTRLPPRPAPKARLPFRRHLCARKMTAANSRTSLPRSRGRFAASFAADKPTQWPGPRCPGSLTQRIYELTIKD